MTEAVPSDLHKSSSLLLPSDDFLNLSETTRFFENSLDAFKEVIEMRSHILLQKKDVEEHRYLFRKTKENFLKVISFYEKYLNIDISITNDITKSKIVTVTFKGHNKYFDSNPFIKFEVLDSKKLKVVKMYPEMKDKENVQQILEGYELILFVNNFRNDFLSLKLKDVS